MSILNPFSWGTPAAGAKTATIDPAVDPIGAEIEAMGFDVKTLEAIVTVGADGFIEPVTFSGSNLTSLLTAATWSYIAITKIARDISALPAVVQRRERANDGSTEWVNDYDHELNKVIARPFGTDSGAAPWTWGQMVETVSMHLDLCGNAYLHKTTSGGFDEGSRLLALQLLLDPTSVKVEEDFTTKVAKGFRTPSKTFSTDDIVNIMNPSVSSFHTGIPTISGGERSVQIDSSAQSRIRYDLEHRLAPGMVFKVKGLFGMQDPQRKKIEGLLRERYGEAKNAGKAMVVGDTADIESAPTADMGDVPEHRKQARDEVLAIEGVPPPVAGIMDAATLQNSAVSLRLYWQLALRPRIGRILDPINLQAVSRSYPDHRIWFELTDNELGLAVLAQRVEVATGLHRDLDYSTNDSAVRVGLNMPRRDELNAMNTTSKIAGRIDLGSPSPSSPPKDDD
jgi:phage portal protein BeeE